MRLIKNQRCWAYISSPKSKCAIYSTLQANTILALDSHGDCWKKERKRETLYPSQGPLALPDVCHTSWILSPAKEWVGAHLAFVHHPTGTPPHSLLHQVGPTLSCLARNSGWGPGCPWCPLPRGSQLCRRSWHDPSLSAGNDGWVPWSSEPQLSFSPSSSPFPRAGVEGVEGLTNF